MVGGLRSIDYTFKPDTLSQLNHTTTHYFSTISKINIPQQLNDTMCQYFDFAFTFCRHKDPIDPRLFHCRSWPECQEVQHTKFRRDSLCSSCLLKAPEVLASNPDLLQDPSVKDWCREWSSEWYAEFEDNTTEEPDHNTDLELGQILLRHAAEQSTQFSTFVDEDGTHHEYDSHSIDLFGDILARDDRYWVICAMVALRRLIWLSLVDPTVSNPTH